jgi:patatin-related protein
MTQMNPDASDASTSARSAVVAKEIRVSVVMYGGVSLAIYMNGVTQELLHLVRSTARTSWHNEPGTEFRFVEAQDPRAGGGNLLKSTEAIYRQLACELNDPGVDDVRFIIDVISGTSAGGINGIFLAKALTDDSLSFDTLQSLWIDEGAIENLLNDDRTRSQAKLPTQGDPKSLLCSDRMYMKLLEALRTMRTDNSAAGQPLCRQIDLFTTTTDINGRVIPLRLADMLVWERRYKQDFHFRYSDQHHNDFEDANNPFLAFMARCTSSFPFAFEPMQLSKLKELQATEAWPKGVKVDDALLQQWQDDFFDNTEQVFTGPNLTRPFGDGGYLNNKPFSYVVSMLGRHSSEFPTERKLIYVEPSPEHPEIGAAASDKTRVPGPIMNSFDALIKLPGFQPIHDDLQRVIERNRQVRKVTELSSAVTASIYVPKKDRSPGASAEEADFALGPKVPLINPSCVGDFSYMVLRVYATTDELADVMAEWFNFTKSSSYYYGLRCIVQAWRQANFEGEGESGVSGNLLADKYREYLSGYDLDFEKRKYRFIREQINTFYSYDEPARSRLKTGFKIVLDGADAETSRRDFQQALILLKGPFDAAYGTIGDAILSLRPQKKPAQTDRNAPLAAAFQILKKAAQRFQAENMAATMERSLGGGDPAQPMPGGGIHTATGGASGIAPTLGKTMIEFVLGIQKQRDGGTAPIPAEFDESYLARAQAVFRDPEVGDAVHQFAVELSKIVTLAAGEGDRLVRRQLDEIKEALPHTAGAEAAFEIVEFFYSRFEMFDAATFPMIYDTGIGTPELISVVRVSPDDATQIFDHPGSQKLAGTALAHFGAFLDRSFRTNDVLWGRLDGAERIIRSLLSGSRLCVQRRERRENELIDEAQSIIIGEYLESRQQDLAAVVHEVAKALMPPVSDASQQAAAVRECVSSTLDALPQQRFREAVEGFLTVERIRQYLSEEPPKREPDRRNSLESIARTVRVVGGMLKGLGDETKAAGGFLLRVATALWWLVEAAVPRGLMGHFFRKFFAMVAWFAIVMVVAGTLLNHAVQTVGFELLGLTAFLWLIKDLFERFLLYGSDRKKGPRLTGLIAVLLALLFISLLMFTRGCLNPWLARHGFPP